MRNPSRHRGEVERPTSVMPRLKRVLFRITPGSRGATVIDQALVTWVRGSDSVLRLDGVSAARLSLDENHHTGNARACPC